eukprot:scaffold306466_cov16-Prasinocladus_malaysianus.AAC.1
MVPDASSSPPGSSLQLLGSSCIIGQHAAELGHMLKSKLWKCPLTYPGLGSSMPSQSREGPIHLCVPQVKTISSGACASGHNILLLLARCLPSLTQQFSGATCCGCCCRSAQLYLLPAFLMSFLASFYAFISDI